MPADVLERAVDRLGRVAAFLAGMVALALGVSVADQRLTGRYPPALEQFWDLVGAATTVAILLLLFLLVRTRALPVPALVRAVPRARQRRGGFRGLSFRQPAF